MVDDAVYHGGGHLVVAEDGPPPRELEAGREDDGLGPAGLGDHLEERPRAVGVEREEPQLVDERGGGEEARGARRLARQHAERLGHVRLAGPDVAHEHEVLPTASHAAAKPEPSAALAIALGALLLPALSLSLSSPGEAASGTGARGLRRRSPTSFSTDPFSLPGQGLQQRLSQR